MQPLQPLRKEKKLKFKTESVALYHGNNIEVLKKFPENYFDGVVTDPPYGLKFMSKKWDYTVPSIEEWKAILRVLKPGGHLLAFGGTRTYHRLVVNIEDAGFEIRDQIQWIYGQGFPKSHDISKAIDKKLGKEREVIGQASHPTSKNRSGTKSPYQAENTPLDANHDITVPSSDEAIQWSGWGTNLKPANEPICLARKPISEKTIAENVLKWGVGGINIDECRIELNGEIVPINKLERWSGFGEEKKPDYESTQNTQGRFPANVIMDEEAGKVLDEQTGVLKSGLRTPDNNVGNEDGNLYNYGIFGDRKAIPAITYGDSGGASRFFYCAKVSKKERGEGNDHPTVKPIELMAYLIRLITPPGGIVLDPYCGSGSTLLAAIDEEKKVVGIDEDIDSFEIAKKRIEEKIK